ncbi:M14-type cytosolic carboxypeptidase [Pseudoalteromonas fenneropenaei]|uniref:M14-type cytosolic carboxypeptidase n=1 Tax=Pseudoalteromonas fenneropenaei TaxID=1737459 RepID=A0ABV7CIL4_9GAMM
MLIINSDFEGGSIAVLQANTADEIQLALKSDNIACAKQWFYFSVETTEPAQHRIRISNASKASFSQGWNDHRAFASYDNIEWFSIETTYNNGELVFTHQAHSKLVYYAYFVPYSSSMQNSLLSDCAKSSKMKLTTIGFTTQHRAIEMVSVGACSASSKQIWIIARQHPGETVAQWIAHGVIEALLAVSDNALENITFNIIANMNPDGSHLGNHRTNALGIDLNRQWHQPSVELCPEVFHVMQAMKSTGVDLFIDLHGDETLPYNFMMVEKNARQGEKLKLRLAQHSELFQDQIDYDSAQTGCGSTTCASACGSKKATTYVHEQFGATSILFEAAMKQIRNPQGTLVWDHKAARQLGAQLVMTLISNE